MLIDSLKERLLTRYGFLYDALDAVRAGKRFSEDEKAALRERYASVSQVVLAERADGYTAELLGSAMLLLNAVSPDRPLAVAESIEKITPVPTIKLRYGIEAASLQFTEPARARWSKQNCEFLVGYQTGLLAPFDRIFVKRVVGTPISGHDLLMKLTGRALPFSPTFLGYVESKPGNHVYFFENLAPGFATLESELNSSAIICPRIITDIVRKAASLFRTIYRFGFVYTDFCAKNIMIERKTRELAIIDIDSCAPMEALLKPRQLKAGGQEEFWGLWNQHLSKSRPVRVENAQKSVLFSFAALWCRALALKYSAGGAALTALKLVHNPSYEAQRPLWEALNSQNKERFLDYFGLIGVNASAVHAQWQAVFNTLKRGQEVVWKEIVSATQNLVTVVGRKAPSTNFVLVNGYNRGTARIMRRLKPEKTSCEQQRSLSV